MATDRDLIRALESAAEALVGKTLSGADKQRLIDLFNKARGTNQDKAKEALRSIAGIGPQELQKRASASDNTDRVIRDLENVIDQWNPGT